MGGNLTQACMCRQLWSPPEHCILRPQKWTWTRSGTFCSFSLALCIQQRCACSAQSLRLPCLTHNLTAAANHSLGSSAGSLTEYAEDSCDQSQLPDDLQTGMHSSASSTASNGDVMLTAATQEPPFAESQGSASSGSRQCVNGSSPDSQDIADVGSSGMPVCDDQTLIDDSLGGREQRQLASRLLAWRVVPLVSETSIRTEDMNVLGMTIS